MTLLELQRAPKEVRPNTCGSGNQPCECCYRFKERTLSDPEIRILGTDKWICWECADQVGYKRTPADEVLLAQADTLFFLRCQAERDEYERSVPAGIASQWEDPCGD